MKVKFSVIPFIPAAIIMLFLRVMSVIGVDESGVFLGMDRMALSYTVIGIALALFIVCILINIFDRKTAPVYPVKKNFASGLFAILSGLTVIASSCLSLIEITTESEYFMMAVISALFSVPAGLALLLMSKVHFTGKSTVSGISFLFVFPALWGCTKLVFEFLNATKVSISATDLTSLFCYIFITLYYFSHSMVVSRIKGRNPVKACFIYGLPAVALSVSHGVYVIVTAMHESTSYISFINAAQFILLGLYSLSFIIEMFSNSYTKDELEIVESLPTEESAEKDEKYIDTKDYDDLVFSNRDAADDPNVDLADDYYTSEHGIDDFVIGYKNEGSEDMQTPAYEEDQDLVINRDYVPDEDAVIPPTPVRTEKNHSKNKGRRFAPESAEPVKKEAAEPVKNMPAKKAEPVSAPVEEKPEPVKSKPESKKAKPEPVKEKPEPEKAKPEPAKASVNKAAETAPPSELELELKKLSLGDDEEIKTAERTAEKTKSFEDGDLDAQEAERLNDIDKLLKELDG